MSRLSKIKGQTHDLTVGALRLELLNSSLKSNFGNSVFVECPIACSDKEDGYVYGEGTTCSNGACE